MIVIIVITLIVAMLFLIGNSILKQGNTENSEVNQTPQLRNTAQSDTKYKKTSPEEMRAAKEKFIQVQKANIDKKQEYKDISFPPKEPGYGYSEMVGMYNLGVTPSEFGICEGYAIAEKGNPHDEFAVGIHRSKDGKLVGYIPRDFRGVSNKEIHCEVSEAGGSVKAMIKITGSEHRSYGSVYLRTGITTPTH